MPHDGSTQHWMSIDPIPIEDCILDLSEMKKDVHAAKGSASTVIAIATTIRYAYEVLATPGPTSAGNAPTSHASGTTIIEYRRRCSDGSGNVEHIWQSSRNFNAVAVILAVFVRTRALPLLPPFSPGRGGTCLTWVRIVPSCTCRTPALRLLARQVVNSASFGGSRINGSFSATIFTHFAKGRRWGR